jgi:hypothetical protein
MLHTHLMLLLLTVLLLLRLHAAVSACPQVHGAFCRQGQQGSACICCLVETQLTRQIYGNRSCAQRPEHLYNALLGMNRGFARWRQEDAHELLRCLTDVMESCLLRQMLGYNPQRPPRVSARHYAVFVMCL